MKKLRKARRQIMVFRWAFPSETFYFAILFAACILSIWILIGRVAFETYSTWDDEGYFILILSHFLKVGGLYVKTYSQYGPFFTLMESSLHRLFDLPVDLDGGRILTASYILGGALLLSFFVGHLTRRLALALPCFVLSVMITAPILDEPGHPTRTNCGSSEHCPVFVVACGHKLRDSELRRVGSLGSCAIAHQN